MKHNKSSHSDAELCEFVASLPPEHLHWLIVTPPLGDNILKHAVECEACAQFVQTAGDSFYMNLPQHNKLRIGATARRGRARYDALAKAPAFAAFNRGALELAASGEGVDSDESPGPVRIAAFDIQGTGFEAFEGAEGSVLLRGAVPPGAARIFLGPDAFVLTKGSASEEWEVENLGSLDLEQFLKHHHGDPEVFPIKFAG